MVYPMQKRLKIILTLVAGLALAPLSSFAAAGGIALGATRVIYPEGASQTSLPVSNSSQNQRFLINSWVEDAEGNKTKSFIVTPPCLSVKQKLKIPCVLCMSVNHFRKTKSHCFI